MINFISFDTNFKLLTRKSSDLNAYTQSYEILSDYKSMMDIYPIVCSCFIYSQSNNLYRQVFQGTFKSVKLKEGLQKYFIDLSKKEKKLIEKTWKPLVIDGRHFVYLLKGYNGTFCIYLIDLDSIDLPQHSKSTTDHGEIIFYQGETLLSDSKTLSDNSIKIKGTDTYYFSGTPKKSMIIEQSLKHTTIRAAYLVEYKGILGNLSVLQFLVSFFSILSILLIPFGYQKLKQVFNKPMDILINTMKEIKSGKLEARVNTAYTEIEFLEVNDTFNSMIEQINRLKIDAYEKELSLKKTQLQYYQIQIKPHFYINCLKNMYGMMEEKKYEDTQKTIIYLSNHLRYMLKNTSMIVPLSTELEYIQNYIALQKLSMAYPPECKINAAPELVAILIPAISILSFVENSIKHAITINNQLCIGIQIHMTQTEDGDYLNIHVSDNGKGFSEEQLKQLNNYLDNQKPEQAIGINNVIQRYLLYFGEENVWFAFSNMNGSHIDIYIRVRRDEMNECTCS
jgi:two-component system sensor histidine kinase YesM